MAGGIISIIQMESSDDRKVPSDLVAINGWVLVALSIIYVFFYPVWTQIMIKRYARRRRQLFDLYGDNAPFLS